MAVHEYLCIDLKSFYASVECVERGLDPLTTDLVVADPERSDKTICLAVSPSLKAKGVKNRCRVFEIPKDLKYIMAPPRMQKYIDYSAEVYGIFLEYLSKDDIHVYSIDESFLDVTHYLKMYDMTARQLAETIMADVLQKTGITATCGIGTNLYLTKIALDITAKHVEPGPGGGRIAELDEISYRKTLWEHKPITDFWRIGTGTAKRLLKYGIQTMGDLAVASLQQEDLLYRIFGIDAELLIDHAWGCESCTMGDIKAYRPKTNCLTSGQVLMQPFCHEAARLTVMQMVDSLVLEMVEKNLICSSFTLYISFDKENIENGTYRGPVYYDHYGRRIPQPAHGSVNFGTHTNALTRIMKDVTGLFEQIAPPMLSVRMISITANDTIEAAFEQYDLFSDPVKLEQERKIQHAVLDIKKKYGKNSIVKCLDLIEGLTGMERNEQIGGHKA